MGSGGESLIKSEKTSTYPMFEINMEIFGGFWFSVTHPYDQRMINTNTTSSLWKLQSLILKFTSEIVTI